MNRRFKIISLILLSAAAVTLIVSTALIMSSPERATKIILADIVIYLLCALVFMTSALTVSLKKTLYSYANIGLIAGILYVSVLAAVTAAFFVRCFSSNDMSIGFIYSKALEFPRIFSYYAVFVLSSIILLLGVSNIALIRHEGLHLHNALSIVLAFFYMGGTAAIYFVSDLIEEYVVKSGSLGSSPVFVISSTVLQLFMLLILTYFECIFVGSAVLGFVAAKKKATYDKDFIIILGCSIDKRGGLLPLLKGRVNGAVRFMWDQEIATGKQAKYVPSGGQGANEIMSEGSAMEMYLLTRGAEEYEVLPEKKSADTYENMCFSKKIIDEVNPEAKVAFATTNYHVLRSGILARMAGLDAEGISCGTKWYFWPNGFVREFIGILMLNVKAHLWTAAVSALVCVAIGCIGYFFSLV